MRRLLLAVLALGSVPGCANGIKPFQPVQPHRAKRPEMTVEIVEASIGQRFQLKLKVRGARGVGLKRALLAPYVAEPCREGVRDIDVATGEKSHWLRPVSLAGAHEVFVTFPHGAGLDMLQQRPMLDLVLETAQGEQCLRIPVSGAAPELAWKRSFDWSITYSWRFAHPFSPVGAVEDSTALSFGLGRWIGPLRLGAQMGIGTSDCRGDCPPAPEGSTGFLLLPMRASLDTYLFQTDSFGIALEGSYGYNVARRHRLDNSPRHEVSHGPGAAIRFDLTATWPQGWLSDMQQGSFGLELGLGHLQSTRNDDSSLYWGIGLDSSIGF